VTTGGQGTTVFVKANGWFVVICKFFALLVRIDQIRQRERRDCVDADKTKLGKLLNRNGCFLTKARLRLFRVLQRHGAMTTREILARLNQFDQATVYRNLNLFEELGVIRKLQMGWHTKFELTDTFQNHHHHLNCLMCGHVIDLPEDSVLESEIARLSYKHKFKAVDHQLEIRGLCSACA
jgi:Fur family ferric uptake transcriptional regulator